MAFFVAYALAASAQTRFTARSSSGHTIAYEVISGTNVVAYGEGSITYTGHVVIPSTVSYSGRSYTVKEVGYFSPSNLKATRVTLPNTITKIRDNAFYLNSTLTSINIPSSVTSVGFVAFCHCTALKTVTFANASTPNTTIAAQCFYGCTALTTLNLGTAVKTIGDNAFSGCTSLTSATIPASVSSIGLSPFQNCSVLSTLNVASGNTVYDSRGGCNAIIKTSSNELIQGCKTTIIPSTVTAIKGNAFQNCLLTSITIPASVSSIGDNAFIGCTQLTSITISASVSSLGVATFRGCTQLTRITIQRSIPPTVYQNTSGSYYYDYWNTFHQVPATAEIIVPCGSAAAYRAAPGWSSFSNYREYDCPYNVDARASDSTLGSVLGGGVHIDGTVATLRALPRAGAAFRGWSDHVADNPRTLSVSRDTALTALFSLQDTLYRTERDTLAAYIVHRGDTARVYLSDTLFSTTSVHDTVEQFLQHLQPDTLYVNLTRHDTLYRHVPVHDTLTTTLNVHDTLWQPVVVAVHDTLHLHHHSTDTLRPEVRHTDTLHRNLPVHDTLRVAVVQYIHDTTYVNVPVHDTLLASIDHQVHDTLIVNYNVHDTLLTVHSITDTLYLRHYRHDTLYLTAFVHDTLHMHHYTHDTLYITRTLHQYIHDTLFQHLEHRLHDTVFLQQCLHDTLYVERYLYHYLHDTLPVDLTHELHDTVFLARYLTDTVERYIDHLVHDTLFSYIRLTDTLYRTRTRYANVHDTVHLYTTLTDTVYVHDTVYVAVDPIVPAKAKVYVSQGRIVVEGALGREVSLYDLSGRLLSARREEAALLTFEVPASGVYLVQVGTSVPHRVAVVLNAR